MKEMLKSGSTPVAMLCLAVQSKGLLKSRFTPVAMLYVSLFRVKGY